MDQIVEVWPSLHQSQPLACAWQCYVSQLFIYPASHQTYQHWRSQGVQGDVLCQDCLLVDRKGRNLRVMVSPVRGTLGILERSFLVVKSVEKLSRGNVQILVLTDWEAGPEFQLQFTGEVKLSGYADQSRPLSNPQSDLLCPWTCSSISWSDPPKLVKKSVLSQLNQILTRFTPDLHNLRRLDMTWSNSSKPIPLVVRVLAKCKEKLIIQQSNHRKSWMCICNLLVADLTAYSVLTVWDEAVAAFHRTVKEGDILVLTSYSVSRLRQEHRKLMHNLAPKVGNSVSGLSATEIECKINLSDLGKIYLLDSAAICDSVPQTVTNFVTSSELARLTEIRLVDMVGMVIYHGRWEREAAWPGHHWVRVWLRVMDHSSDNLLSIKVFPDLESWAELEDAVPGQVVVLTNLIIKVNEKGDFSHLESTNQTGVFTNQNALNCRFLPYSVVNTFKTALDTNLVRWADAISEKGGLGGQFCIGSAVVRNMTPTDTEDALHSRAQLAKEVTAVEIRSSSRFLVRGRISGAKLMKVDQVGKFTEIKTLMEEDEESKTFAVFGPEGPSLESFSSTINQLDKEQLLISVKYNCFLNISLGVKKPDTVSYRELQFGLVSFLLDDCKIYSLVDADRLALMTETVSEYFRIDVFRPGLSQRDEVEFVLRQVMELNLSLDSTLGSDSKGKEEQDISLLDSTQEFAKTLL